MAESAAGPTRVVAIVGMHRSGTSCLAGSLERAGLAVGRVHTWNRYNTRGNRENQDFVDLNDEVLAANGGSWDAPPQSCNWSAAQLARARALAAELGDGAVVGFKDPRTLLTLDGWRTAVPGLYCVGAFRDPRAVLTSLARRSAMGADTALALWTHYNAILLREARRCASPLVDFDVTETAYADRVGQIATRLGLGARSMHADPFFSEALRTAQLSPASRPLPWRVRLLHWRLRRWAQRSVQAPRPPDEPQ